MHMQERMHLPKNRKENKFSINIWIQDKNISHNK